MTQCAHIMGIAVKQLVEVNARAFIPTERSSISLPLGDLTAAAETA